MTNPAEEIRKRQAKEEEEVSHWPCADQVVYWKWRYENLEEAAREVIVNSMNHYAEQAGEEIARNAAGANAVHKKHREAKQNAIELARELRDTNPNCLIKDAAGAIVSEIQQGGISVAESTVRGWIAPLWPAEARKPGRRRAD